VRLVLLCFLPASAYIRIWNLIGLLHFFSGVKTLRATPTNLRVSQVVAAYLKLGNATPIMTVAMATRLMKRTAQTKSAASMSLLAQVKCAFL